MNEEGTPMNDRVCPTCGRPHPELTDPYDDSADALTAEFKMTCAERGYAIRAGRVSESVAAELLGIRKLVLAGRRRSGSGPRAFHMPIDGSRYSYELRELAAWQANHDVGETWL
jgi:hypothetical protein